MSFFESASLVFISDFAAASASMVSGSGTDTGKAYNIKPIKELGSELIVNGDFSTDSDWTKVNATISGGTGNLNGTGVTSLIYQSGVLTQNKTYRLTFSVLNYNGLGQLEVINNDGTSYYLATSNGNNIVEFTHAISNQNFLFRARNNAIAEIDNVSVKEVTTPPADFDFERGSDITATRVNSSGLIEKGRGNFLLKSNLFDNGGIPPTAWTKINASLTSGQSGYDGTNNAWLLENSTGNLNAYVKQDKVFNNVQTASVYAKKGNVDYIYLRLGGSSSRGIYVNLSNGTLSSQFGDIIDYKITPIGSNGWYRISVTYDGNLSNFRIYPSAAGGTSTSLGDNIYIQDAQLEQGLVATDYIETTTEPLRAGILEDEPRFDYHNSASATPNTCPSLLLEPGRTNSIAYSEYFEGTNWGVVGPPTLTLEDINSPEGVANAYSIVKRSATDNTDRVQQSLGGLGTNHVFSIFLKLKSTTDTFNVRLANNAGERVEVEVSTDGTIVVDETPNTTATNYDIENYGNGWYRLWMETTTSATSNFYQIYPNITNTSVGECYFYGAQAEEGSYPTSYIPTYGVASEREADLGTLSTLPETLSTNYTIFGETTRLISNDETGDNMIELRGTAFSRFRLIANPNSYTRLRFYPSDGSASISLYETTGKWSQGSTIKWAFVYQSDSIEGFVNGESIGTTSANMEFTSLFLRTASKLKKILLFTKALSTTDLEILTGATTYSSFAAMASALNYTVYE